MTFSKRQRDGVRRGKLTVGVRIWKTPRVQVGNRYAMEERHVESDSIEAINFAEITPQLTRW